MSDLRVALSSPISSSKYSTQRIFFKCDMHYHNQFELYYLLSGYREYLIDGESIALYPNDAILIPPGIIHQTIGSQFERILINFDYSALTPYFSKHFLTTLLDDLPSYITSTIPLSLQPFFEKIHNASQEKHITAAPLNIVELLLFIKENQTQKPSTLSSNDLLTRIRRYIIQNYTTINSLDEIADAFQISKFYLSHLFKKYLNTTVVYYLNSIKISNACRMLKHSNTSITNIAINCGFNSPSYFHKIFKKFNGISAAQYRKNQHIQ